MLSCVIIIHYIINIHNYYIYHNIRGKTKLLSAKTVLIYITA